VSLDSAIAYFRQEQADLFRSTCDIKYQSGEAFDDITGAVTPTYTTRAQDVPCLIRPRSTTEVQAGEEEVTLGQHLGKFPVDQELEIGDLIDLTASRHDAELVGKTFMVKERLLDDWQICRRAVLEVNEG